MGQWRAALPNLAQREVLDAERFVRQGNHADAAAALERAWQRMRVEPWLPNSEAESSLQLARTLGMASPQLARRLASALATPFAVERLREDRLTTQLALARMAKDASLCLAPLAGLVVAPWQKEPLETQVWCFESLGDRRLSEARADLARLLEGTAPFGASVANVNVKVPPAPDAADAGGGR